MHLIPIFVVNRRRDDQRGEADVRKRLSDERRRRRHRQQRRKRRRRRRQRRVEREDVERQKAGPTVDIIRSGRFDVHDDVARDMRRCRCRCTQRPLQRRQIDVQLFKGCHGKLRRAQRHEDVRKRW